MSNFCSQLIFVCFSTRGFAGDPLYTSQAMSTSLLNPLLGLELSERQHGVRGFLFY